MLYPDLMPKKGRKRPERKKEGEGKNIERRGVKCRGRVCLGGTKKKSTWITAGEGRGILSSARKKNHPLTINLPKKKEKRPPKENFLSKNRKRATRRGRGGTSRRYRKGRTILPKKGKRKSPRSASWKKEICFDIFLNTRKGKEAHMEAEGLLRGLRLLDG